MDVITKDAILEFEPKIAAQYPVGRIFDYQGHQVVITRGSDYVGHPTVVITFQSGAGICSATSPYPMSDEGGLDRDSQYAAMVGHDALPQLIVDIIRTVWQDKGRPPKEDPDAVFVRRGD